MNLNELDAFFDDVEADQHAHQERLKDYALFLLLNSSMQIGRAHV